MSERRTELKAVTNNDTATWPVGGRDWFGITARMMDGWNNVNGRLVSLAQDSWRNSLAAAQELRQCQTPADLVDTQLRLSRQAVDSYFSETRALAELVTKVSSEALNNLGLPR